ncbi:uncharacterized protein LOC144115479 isoform X2 [Amblyomma americanum]
MKSGCADASGVLERHCEADDNHDARVCLQNKRERVSSTNDPGTAGAAVQWEFSTSANAKSKHCLSDGPLKFHQCGYEELQEADHQEQEIFDCFDRFNVPCAAVTPLDTRSLLKTNNSIEV